MSRETDAVTYLCRGQDSYRNVPLFVKVRHVRNVRNVRHVTPTSDSSPIGLPKSKNYSIVNVLFTTFLMDVLGKLRTSVMIWSTQNTLLGV
jgi:hypothetical protein